MPVKFGLKFMAVICTAGFYPKWKFLNDIINRIYRIGLIMALIDPQYPNARWIINGSNWNRFTRLPVNVLKKQEVDINLYMMTRNTLLVAFKWRDFTFNIRTSCWRLSNKAGRTENTRESSAQALGLIEARYNGGLTGFIKGLDAQRGDIQAWREAMNQRDIVGNYPR